MWAYLPCSHPSSQPVLKTHQSNLNFPELSFQNILSVTINSILAKWTQMIVLLSWKDWRDILLVSPLYFIPTSENQHCLKSLMVKTGLMKRPRITALQRYMDERLCQNGFLITRTFKKHIREALKSGLRKVLKRGV